MENDINKIEKKALLAIKISIAAIFISLILGIFSLWVVLNQVTISVGIDKKLKQIEMQLETKSN
ncbi:MAG: DUF5408 family protein [Helicobacteraceae bacterium]|nr:DUF5408 family protein [Helicobacteraceae bacterium]